MQIQISGKQIEIGQALPEAVRSRFDGVVGKYFNGGGTAHVVFSHEGAFYRADISVHLDAGAVIKAEGDAADVHKAFDLALDRLQAQIRRYMEKLKSHHG